MRKCFMLLLLYLAVLATADARVRRVGFIATINPINGTDYYNFQAAHDASLAGDTIQLYPNTLGTAAYSGTISKPLVITGPGYFTNSYYLSGSEIGNSNLQNLAGSISSCSFTIELGSAGSIFQGLNNVTLSTADRVDALNSITIRRCRNVTVSFTNSGLCNNWTVAQCYGVSIAQSGFSGSFTGDRTIDNLSIRNSVLFSGINLNTSPAGTYTGNTIYNCAFLSGHSLSLNNAAFTVQNCIFENQNFTGVTNVAFIKNITSQSATSNPVSTNAGSSGNQFNIAAGSVFAGYPTNASLSVDNRFSLKSGANPAVNGGFVPGTSTATDCGIFGGGTGAAYVLSGIPTMPAVYQLGAPNAITTGSTYTLTFSVRNNN